jgi:hypothetical protein
VPAVRQLGWHRVGDFTNVSVGWLLVAAVVRERVARDLVCERFVQALGFSLKFGFDAAPAVVF